MNARRIVDPVTMPPVTMECAKTLHRGVVLFHRYHRNKDGSPERWRVSGSPKTWKTRPHRIRVPVKCGLRWNDALDEESLALVSLYDGDRT